MEPSPITAAAVKSGAGRPTSTLMFKAPLIRWAGKAGFCAAPRACFKTYSSMRGIGQNYRAGRSGDRIPVSLLASRTAYTQAFSHGFLPLPDRPPFRRALGAD